MIKRLLLLARHLGMGWVLFRLIYFAQLRLGVLRRRTPAVQWAEVPLRQWLLRPELADPDAYIAYRRRADRPRHFATASSAPAASDRFDAWDLAVTSPRMLPLAEAQRIMAGWLIYFSLDERFVGFPPAWHTHPFGAEGAPNTLPSMHWSQVDEFASGDVKLIWEPNRFGFAYALSRAVSRARAHGLDPEPYAEAFWTAFESWIASNPPNHGSNWKCGQETTFRVMAWCFALAVMESCRATTPQRLAAMAQAIAVSGSRIAGNLDYALSQHNNHSVSEALGLWTIGTLFPEFREAPAWRKLGRRWLEKLAMTLVYEDGSFSQHSVNYHRVMLHDFAWALALDNCNNRELSAELRARVSKAVDWLQAVTDVETGGAPRYGANDGALILPLTNCAYADYRPVVQSLRVLLDGRCAYGPGPWDEEAYWLGIDVTSAMQRDLVSTPNLSGGVGGYHVLRQARSFVFTRCPERFLHRPSHADLLHVDLWWRGINVLQDAGTYSYNPDRRTQDGFEHTRYHNTVTVNGLDQMSKYSRFLWLPWAHGTLIADAGGVECVRTLRIGHDGYERTGLGVRHTRSIESLANVHSEIAEWRVIDDLACTTPQTYVLHWLMPDIPYRWDFDQRRLVLHSEMGDLTLTFEGMSEISLVRADEMTLRGWYAPQYNTLRAALSVRAIMTASTARFITAIRG